MAKSDTPSPSQFEDILFPCARVKPDGAVVACNHAFLRLIGRKALPETTIEELFQPMEVQHFAELFEEARKTGGKSIAVRRAVAYHQHLLTSIVKYEIGPGTFFIQLLSEKDVRFVSPSGALSLDFLSGLSHHLRTPVNGVLGIADLLAGTDLDDRQSVYVDILSKSCTALVHLVEEIQSISLLEQGTMQLNLAPADVCTVAEKSLDHFTDLAHQKQVFTKLETASSFPRHFMVDAAKLEQILSILLDNAYRYTDQGTVTLSIDEIELRDTIGGIVIKVIDSGAGIAQERLPSLFTGTAVGQQSKSDIYSHTGLGLILCHKLIELMGGEIVVESQVGRGSTFILKIPAVQVPGSTIRAQKMAADQSTAEYGAAPSKSPQACWNILLAEDNPVNQMLFRKMLERFGHHVTVVANGQEAVAKVQLGIPYDIILMDISMPVMDGLNATAMIRSLMGDVGSTPILALTAHAMEGDREKFINAGMDGYQSKPVDPLALQKAMTDVISNRADKNAGTKARQKDVGAINISEDDWMDVVMNRPQRS